MKTSLVALVVASAASIAVAQQAPYAVIKSVEGLVTVTSNNQLTNASANMPLQQGAEVLSTSNGKATIQFCQRLYRDDPGRTVAAGVGSCLYPVPGRQPWCWRRCWWCGPVHPDQTADRSCWSGCVVQPDPRRNDAGPSPCSRSPDAGSGPSSGCCGARPGSDASDQRRLIPRRIESCDGIRKRMPFFFWGAQRPASRTCESTANWLSMNWLCWANRANGVLCRPGRADSRTCQSVFSALTSRAMDAGKLSDWRRSAPSDWRSKASSRASSPTSTSLAATRTRRCRDRLIRSESPDSSGLAAAEAACTKAIGDLADSPIGPANSATQANRIPARVHAVLSRWRGVRTP